MKLSSLFTYLLMVCIGFRAPSVLAQHPLNIDVSSALKPVMRPLTKLGGSKPSGEKIAVNNYYITKGGVPVIPITGEFHFSRYPNAYWDESIKKIKAGGINTIATYVFWNIHEEKEGAFNWSGDRDLRKFIELCAKNNIDVIVRIGPFDHGEIRNGGLPDWLLGKPLIIRSNDPLYLHYVEALYQQIGKQLKGLYYKDGGPVIGIQLENEYQHSASPWGLTYPGQPHDFTVADRDRNSAHEGVAVADANNPYANVGNDHMRTLKSFANKYGMNVPIYTATGWGYAAIIPDETLPVTAAYAYPTWVSRAEPSPFYLYKDLHALPDYSPVRYNPTDYPAFAAELGAGMSVNYVRRPTVLAESVDALINRCLGGGANGIGYYMYHGGSNPVGEHYFFSDEAYDYPKISYDYQAPIGEYGQIRPSYKRLKLLHSFINDFAPVLAEETTVLPENAATLKPENLTSVRYAVRTNGTSGFVFFNNFQDNAITPDKKNISLTLKTAGGIIRIPQAGGFDIQSGENLIIPFNLSINDCHLIYSTAQLLTKCNEPGNQYDVFFSPSGTKAAFLFSSSTTVAPVINTQVYRSGDKTLVKCTDGMPALFTIKSRDGAKTSILVISKAFAENFTFINIDGKKHLLFSGALILQDGKDINLYALENSNFDLKIFPKTLDKPTLKSGSLSIAKTDGIFTNFRVALPEVKMQAKITKTGIRKMGVELPAEMPAGLNDIFLRINYWGDTGMAFQNNELVADDFYRGAAWEIGLRRFIGQPDKSLNFYFRPLAKNSPFIIDLPNEVLKAANEERELLKINAVSLIPEYKTTLKF